MKVIYDTPGDILYIEHVPPHADQIYREVAEGVYVRVNRATEAIEGYMIHGLSHRPGEFVELMLPDALEVQSPA